VVPNGDFARIGKYCLKKAAFTANEQPSLVGNYNYGLPGDVQMFCSPLFSDGNTAAIQPKLIIVNGKNLIALP
jgi:hypothetical protein